jgi:DNA helicase-2/ATP-dependent DNA helicase PcrA
VREHYGGRFAHVLVDEYQDTNHAQYRLVRSWASVHGNVCVVGDDDQSIYGWRGADLRNILDFERDFQGTAVVRLEQNYRSTGAILNVANAVIARNRARKEKWLRTERSQGARVVVAALRDERAEASWTVRQVESHRDRYTLGEVGVLYRTNAQSRAYEDALRGAGMPYRVVGGIRFYERREVKDVLAYLQLLVNPADDTAFFRAIGWPRRGVGAVTLERMEAARSRSDGTLLDVAAAAREVEGLSGGAARALALFARDLGALADLVPVASSAEVAEESDSEVLSRRRRTARIAWPTSTSSSRAWSRSRRIAGASRRSRLEAISASSSSTPLSSVTSTSTIRRRERSPS